MARNKTIFAVKMENKGSDNDYFDMNNINITITKGVKGVEMAYSICALLAVVMAKENESGNKFTVDSFLHYIGMLMKDVAIGIPNPEVKK